MKKKNKKKFKRKIRKLKKNKISKLKKKNKHRKIRKNIKKPKKQRKIKSHKRKRIRISIPLKIKRKKITKKPKIRELSFQKLINFILKPIFNVYEDFKEKRKIKKLKQIDLERKEKEQQIKKEEKLRKQIKEYEFQDELRIARMRSQDLKRFIRAEQAIIRKEQADKRRRFLEELQLEKKIKLFRERELQQIENLEKAALKEEREDYRPVLERLEKIKLKYKLIRESKVREKIKSLGIEVLDTDTKEDLLEKEKKFSEQRNRVEIVLESFFRSAQSLIFQINKRWIPRHKSILRVIDRRWEENLFYVRYDDEIEDNWLMLIYLEDENPDKETIIVEDKTDEKYITKSFNVNSVFSYSDWMVDRWVHHLDRERQKKAS